MNEVKEETKKFKSLVQIKVVGVGGGGNNAIHSMVREGIKGIELIVANTDEQVLNNSIAHTILPLGNSSKGLGAGANPEKGKKAALESENTIKETLKDADMVIVSAGMGGGTGTGAAPIIAKLAKEMGALTIGIVTTPFSFEGTQRLKNTKEGLVNMRKNVDSLIVISNDKLLEQYGGIPLQDSFMYANKTLKQTVRTITDLIAVPSLINLDFADVISIMKDKGAALIGIGRATGEDRDIKAATHAISSPILDVSIKGATDAIINISGGDITLDEASKAVKTIKEAAGGKINIIFGISVVEALANELQVSVIATGLIEKTNEVTKEELKTEVANALKTMDIEFSSEKTRELLVSNPLPEDEKLTIDDEIALTNSPFEVSDEDDEDELPAFLRK